MEAVIDSELVTSIAILAGLLTVGSLVAIVRIRGIKRDLRNFAYLQRDDPAAYHALINAHRPTLSRMTTALLASLTILALLAAVVVAEMTGLNP